MTFMKIIVIFLLCSFLKFSSSSLSFYNNVHLGSASISDVSYLKGQDVNGKFGNSVSSAGDFNGDGYEDVVIGAYWHSSPGRHFNGIVYVYYGSSSPAYNITQSSGFAIFGEYDNNFAGVSVSNAGDVNKDGYSDIIVGAYIADQQGTRPNAGTSYVVFGHGGAPQDVDLQNLGPTDGFRIFGANENDYSGAAVNYAGDVNHDGYSDIIIGAFNATHVPYANTGAAYVIYGKANGFTDIDLWDFTQSQTDGYAIFGSRGGDNTGISVSGSDVNGDSYSDLIIGADSAGGTGKIYIVFGQSSKPGNFNLKSLNSNQGLVLSGVTIGDGFGYSVAGLRDISGDGIPDFAVGAHWANSGSRAHAGIVYILYGKSAISSFNLGSMTNSDGFQVIGGATNYNTGCSVRDAGDVNGDGVGDIIIGSNQANVRGKAFAGISHVVFGASVNSNIDLLHFPHIRGFSISGVGENDFSGSSVSGGFDFNKDGYGDVVIGAYGANPDGKTGAGMAYIVYGKPSPSPTGAPTNQPSSQPSRTPTSQPSTHPTSQPTPAPTPAPTFAPTLPVIYNNVYFRLKNVGTNSLSKSGQNAVLSTIYEVLSRGVSASYEGIPNKLKITRNSYELVVETRIIEPLENFRKIYGTNVTKFAQSLKDELITSVKSAQFNTYIQRFAQNLSATELYNVNATLVEFDSYTIIPGSNSGSSSSNNGTSKNTLILILCVSIGGFFFCLLIVILCWKYYWLPKTQEIQNQKETDEQEFLDVGSGEIVAQDSEIFSYIEAEEKNVNHLSFKYSHKDLEIGDGIDTGMSQ